MCTQPLAERRQRIRKCFDADFFGVALEAASRGRRVVVIAFSRSAAIVLKRLIEVARGKDQLDATRNIVILAFPWGDPMVAVSPAAEIERMEQAGIQVTETRQQIMQRLQCAGMVRLYKRLLWFLTLDWSDAPAGGNVAAPPAEQSLEAEGGTGTGGGGGGATGQGPGAGAGAGAGAGTNAGTRPPPGTGHEDGPRASQAALDLEAWRRQLTEREAKLQAAEAKLPALLESKTRLEAEVWWCHCVCARARVCTCSRMVKRVFANAAAHAQPCLHYHR